MKILFLQDLHGLLFNKKDRIFYFLLLFFFFSIYAPGITWLYNVSMWLFFVYCFFYNTIAQKWTILKSRKEILLIIIFFLLNCVSALLSTNQSEAWSFVGIRLNLLALPIAIGTIVINNNLKERLILGFAVATTFAAISCLGWSFWQSIKYHDLSLLYNDNLSAVINLQSIYFAMLVNLAIFSYVFLIEKKSSIINLSLIQFFLLLLFIINFLLASRSAIIILYSSTFIFAIINFIRKKKLLEGATLILGLMLSVWLLPHFFPKTVNRFKELSYTKFEFGRIAKESHFNAKLTPDQWNGANERIAIWECALTTIKSHPFFGVGLGDKKDELMNGYMKKGFLFGLITGKNTHNNYLDILMSMGGIVFIIFLLGFFILPISYCIKYSDWYGMVILLSFMFALFSENYMDRTIGNTILAFFISFISCFKKPKTFLLN